jgi:hypothetical protein
MTPDMPRVKERMGIGIEESYDGSAHGKPILVDEDEIGEGCGCGKGP